MTIKIVYADHIRSTPDKQHKKGNYELKILIIALVFCVMRIRIQAHGLLEKRIRLSLPHIGDYNKHVLPGSLPMGIKFLLTKEAGIIMTTPNNAA